MRYHRAGLAALATQPSHQFDREGVLLLKERHDSFFRRSEVSCERWCRLRGNLLCYFKTRDHWSEPVGLLVLENCVITLEETARHAFTIEFGTGFQQVCEAASEADRDGWVAAIRATSLSFLAQKVQALQLQVDAKKTALEATATSKVPTAAAPSSVVLELSLSCDNLRCDGTGLPPASCVQVQLGRVGCWRTAHTTEIIQGSSNPVFVTSVVLGGGGDFNTSLTPDGDGGVAPLEDSSRVRFVVRRVLEPLSFTSTIIGTALSSVCSLRSSARQRLPLVSLAGDAVGFVSVASWAADGDGGFRAGQPGAPPHSTPTHAQPTEVVCQHRRTQSLPPRLSAKSRLPTPPQLCPTHTNPITVTYRFHSGLGGDIAVVEIMAESRLTFSLPQQMLSIWHGAERAYQEEVEALGFLSEPWHSRQRALVAMYSSRSQLYQDASAALSRYAADGRSFKRSIDKENPMLEFAPINLHLQRVWAQNESLRRTGFYDVHTVGAFAANAQGCSHGGLLTLLQEQSRRGRDEASSRADCSRAAVDTTRRLRTALATSLNGLLAALRCGAIDALHGLLEDIKGKIELLLSALEPDMVEAAFDFLDQIKVPQSPSHILTLASRNYSVHSNLAGYLSPESSLDHTIGLHLPQPNAASGGAASRGAEAGGATTSTDVALHRPHDTGLDRVPDVRLGGQAASDRLLSPSEEFSKSGLESASNIDAKYYCSTDEPEPWDLIKLNLQASFICLSAKVTAICNSCRQKPCTSPSGKLAPLAHIDGLSDVSRAGSCDVLTQNTTTPDVSPTEDDSGIGMERNTPEMERRPQVSASTRPSSASASTALAARDSCDDAVYREAANKGSATVDSGGNDASARPKLASIMETSKEDNIEGDDLGNSHALGANLKALNVKGRHQRTECAASCDSLTISSTNRSSVRQDRLMNCYERKSSVDNISESILSVSIVDSRSKRSHSLDAGKCDKVDQRSNRNIAIPNDISIIFSTNASPSTVSSSGLPPLNEPTSSRCSSAVPCNEDSFAASSKIRPNNVDSKAKTLPNCTDHATSTSSSVTTSAKEGPPKRPDDVPVSLTQAFPSAAVPQPPLGISPEPSSDVIASVVPSIVKLRGAVDGAVRTARLVHSLHRLQLPTDAIHQTHGLQYRRDVCFSQALTAATSGLMARLWSRAADQAFLSVLQRLGPLLQFEGLLSCYSGDGARISDMVVAIEDLATVLFVLVPDTGGGGGAKSSHFPQPAVAGNRCALRVLLPVPESVLCLMPRDSTTEPITFHITPVFFNIGINNEATLAGKLGLEGPQHRNNLDSFHRLAEYHHRYAKLNLPVENTKRLWCGHTTSSSSLPELMEKLRVAVHLNKSKNTEVLALASAVTRAMGGVRFISCKSGKDRTGMSATLEQTNLLAAEFDLARTELQRALQAMRSKGTRLINCEKNIGVKKFAFNSIQLAMFPRNYVPPHGTYGSTVT